MKIKYNHVKLSKISLALIYSLLDMINSPNSNTLCTNQSNLFFEFLGQSEFECQGPSGQYCSV